MSVGPASANLIFSAYAEVKPSAKRRSVSAANSSLWFKARCILAPKTRHPYVALQKAQTQPNKRAANKAPTPAPTPLDKASGPPRAGAATRHKRAAVVSKDLQSEVPEQRGRASSDSTSIHGPARSDRSYPE